MAEDACPRRAHGPEDPILVDDDHQIPGSRPELIRPVAFPLQRFDARQCATDLTGDQPREPGDILIVAAVGAEPQKQPTQRPVIRRP